MRVTICQLPDTPDRLEIAWEALCEHVRKNCSDWLLLPEMPFSVWLSAIEKPSVERWSQAEAEHRRWLARFGELGDCAIASSLPVVDNGIPYNEGFLFDTESGYRALHRKNYLPNEPGFWESRWYREGAQRSPVVEFRGSRVAMQLCTEIWFTDDAREMAKEGVELLFCPRSTAGLAAKWIVAGQAAAIMSGAYCFSSNRMGRSSEIDWVGTGWAIEPEDAEVLATTEHAAPFRTVEIDLNHARSAKESYPRYVKERP